jgi:hypothetical protein
MNLIREYLETANILAQMEEDDFENEDLVLVFNQSAARIRFIAQEIENSELAKYILIKDELDNGKHIYGVDNYAYTTAIHGALQYEIELRDKQYEELKKENENLKNELQELKQTILKGE